MTYKTETENPIGVMGEVCHSNIPLKRNENSGSNIKNIKIIKLLTK